MLVSEVNHPFIYDTPPNPEWKIGGYSVVQANDPSRDTERVWALREDSGAWLATMDGTNGQYQAPLQGEKGYHKQLIAQSVSQGETYFGIGPEGEDVFTFNVTTKGSSYLWPPAEWQELSLYLSRFMVARKHKGEGIGAQVLDDLTQRAYDEGLQWLRIEIWNKGGEPNRDLLAYYFKHGFADLEIPETMYEGGVASTSAHIHPAAYRMQRSTVEDEVAYLSRSWDSSYGDKIPHLGGILLNHWRNGLFDNDIIHFCNDITDGWLETRFEFEGQGYGESAFNIRSVLRPEQYVRHSRFVGLGKSLIALAGRGYVNPMTMPLRYVAIEWPASKSSDLQKSFGAYVAAAPHGKGVLVQGKLSENQQEISMKDCAVNLAQCYCEWRRSPRVGEIGLQPHDAAPGESYSVRLTLPQTRRGQMGQWSAKLLLHEVSGLHY